MPWVKAGSALVITAQQFNPAIINQVWLVRNGILREEDFLPGGVFTDLFVQLQSRRFQMLILQNQLQFIPGVPTEQEQELVVETVGPIVRTLPHTPYRAIGLNFNWHLLLPDGNVHRATRGLFFREQVPLFRNFESEDAHFGGYLSKNVLGFRLKLDIKPILVDVGGRQENRIQFAFNFHADLGADPVQEVQGKLLRWNETQQEVFRILDCVEPREG